MPWSTFPGSKENGLKCFTEEVGGYSFFILKKYINLTKDHLKRYENAENKKITKFNIFNKKKKKKS